MSGPIRLHASNQEVLGPAGGARALPFDSLPHCGDVFIFKSHQPGSKLSNISFAELALRDLTNFPFLKKFYVVCLKFFLSFFFN